MPWYTVSAAGVMSLNGLSGDVTLAVVGGSIAAAGSTITITVTPGATSWDALTGKPTTFPPSAHNHAITDVSGLQTALDAKQAAGSYAAASHTHTAGQVSGLATVATSGSAGDLTGTLSDARLSANVPILVAGVLPSSYLPSFVDDVLEAATLSAFPATGETGKIYVARDTNRTYRWSGSTYVEISASPGSTDAVSEGSINLYFTTARASAAAPVQSVAGRSGAVVLAKADVGLGSVDNTADSSKPVSTAQAAADAAVQAHAIQRANHTGTQAVGTITGLGGAATLSVGTTAGTVAAGNDARFSDARTPTSHVHGNITNAGAIGTVAGRILTTDTDGLIVTSAVGVGMVYEDGSISPDLPYIKTQLSTVATTGAYSDLTGKPTIPSAYTLPAATVSTLGGVIVGTGLSVTSGTASVSYGTSGTTACVGNDARLSDARTPTAHNQAFSTITATPTTLTGYGITNAATLTHVHGNITNAGAIGSTSGQIVVTTTSGVLTTSAMIAASAVSGLAAVATSGAYADLSGKPTIYARSFAWASPYSYSGRAVTGSATSASVWTIKRSQISASGSVTATLTATNVAWDNYAAATYS